MRIYLLLSCLVPVMTVNSCASSYWSIPEMANTVHRHTIGRARRLANDLKVVTQEITFRPHQKRSRVAQQVFCTLPNPFEPGPNVASPSAGPTLTSATDNGGSSTSRIASISGFSASTATSSNVVAPTFTSIYKLQESHSGSNFFPGWVFFTDLDPTGGIANYVDQNTAQQMGLISVKSNGNAVMKVDTTPVITGNRSSVRITTQSTFTGGLFVLDAVHMPTGCGTWPAFWTNGPNWPVGGEIDVVEGVNDYTVNQVTIHTGNGCSLPATENVQNQGFTGTILSGTNCSSFNNMNAGCGIRSASSNTFGPGFNSNGGGVYAMLWNDMGITVWFFPRGSTPADLTAEAPEPDGWATPIAHYPSTSCNITQFFYDHSVIFDTTLCGQWPDGVWLSSGVPGQDQSCAARTGVASCEDFVRNHGSAFEEAYWEIASVKIYQTTRQT